MRDQTRDSIERGPPGIGTEFKRQQESLGGIAGMAVSRFGPAVEERLFGGTESSLTGFFEKEKKFPT
ncbi:hypothetical protein N9B17_04790 [Rhodopirellula sp.]|nr:hypothetical protein [Rhodopirellula sp.]